MMATNKVSFDASVSAKWVFDEPMADAARQLLDDCARNDIEITVPPLWAYELDSILRDHVYRAKSPRKERTSSDPFYWTLRRQ